MDVYEILREILDTHPVGAPKSVVFDKILKILFILSMLSTISKNSISAILTSSSNETIRFSSNGKGDRPFVNQD